MRGLLNPVLRLWAVCAFLAIAASALSETSVLPASKDSSIEEERLAALGFFSNSVPNYRSQGQIKRFIRKLAAPSASSSSSGSGWVGIQAITVFLVIIAAVAFALFLRPSSINRSQYQPV